MPRKPPPPVCPVDALLRLLMGSWTTYILWHLRHEGPLRFGVLRRRIPGISSKVLTQRLRMLEDYGIIYRRHVPVIPPGGHLRLDVAGRGTRRCLRRAEGRIVPLAATRMAEQGDEGSACSWCAARSVGCPGTGQREGSSASTSSPADGAEPDRHQGSVAPPLKSPILIRPKGPKAATRPCRRYPSRRCRKGIAIDSARLPTAPNPLADARVTAATVHMKVVGWPKVSTLRALSSVAPVIAARKSGG